MDRVNMFSTIQTTNSLTRKVRQMIKECPRLRASCTKQHLAVMPTANHFSTTVQMFQFHCFNMYVVQAGSWIGSHGALSGCASPHCSSSRPWLLHGLLCFPPSIRPILLKPMSTATLLAYQSGVQYTDILAIDIYTSGSAVTYCTTVYTRV